LRKRIGKHMQVASAELQDSTSDEQQRTGIVAEEKASFSSHDHVLDNVQHSSLEVSQKNSPDAIITLDEQFFMRDLNPSAVKLLGVSLQDAVDHKCMDVLSCKNLNRMQLCGTSSCPLTRVLKYKKPLPNEDLLIGNEHNHTCEVSTSITPISIDGISYAVFIARDMSALKVANQVRANFVSMVSHELRTPLNSVHGFIELLLQGHMGDLKEEQRTYLGYTQEGVQQLISIVEDILFMTRSDLGQFETRQQEVPLHSLVKQVVGSLQPQAMKSGVVIYQDIPTNTPSLYIDPQRIKQVLNNLVTNAIKFTPPGGTVTISSRRADETMQMISIIDTGYGILTEDRPHVFERFYQSNHSQQSKMGGYGLGLSIARLIVEQHGGVITFDTVVDKGTTFSFTVPIYNNQDTDA
jgi:PAS domain S-box-containing protein